MRSLDEGLQCNAPCARRHCKFCQQGRCADIEPCDEQIKEVEDGED